MTTPVFSNEIPYAKKDVAELEQASVRVHRIFGKVAAMLETHLPVSLWDAWIGVPYAELSALYSGETSIPLMQKWVQGPQGWRCIGYEVYSPPQGSGAAGTAKAAGAAGAVPHIPADLRRAGKPGLVLQAAVWSLFDNLIRFHPLLGGELFLDGEELETVASYIVPTYVGEPGHTRPCITYDGGGVRISQEWVNAPTIALRRDGAWTEGRWMTGVVLERAHFAGLGPYVKQPDGGRTYMQAFVQ